MTSPSLPSHDTRATPAPIRGLESPLKPVSSFFTLQLSTNGTTLAARAKLVPNGWHIFLIFLQGVSL